MASSRLTSGATHLLAVTTGTAFGVAARVRRGKPIHPAGVLVSASVRWHGLGPATGPSWGSPWLDEPGETGGFVRLSRSAGLPHPLPDMLGFAMRVPTGAGSVGDLLLTTCAGRAPVLRRLLAPRWDAAVAYSSILSFRTRRGPAVIAAWPSSDRTLPPMTADLAAALAAAPLTFGLHVAEPRGEWEQFATVELAGPLAGAAIDPPVSFDPVRNAPPGLEFYDLAAAVRARSYAAARRNRPEGDDPPSLHRTDRPVARRPRGK